MMGLIKMACTVGTIIKDICAMVGYHSVDTTAVDGQSIRGFTTSGVFNASDAIRTLQSAYFFDLPEIDGQLVVVKRGGAIKATISRDEMVADSIAKFETSREQGVEFPSKVHVAYSSAESDYTPTKETAERRSVDVEALSELTVEVPINLTSELAVRIADSVQKVAWVEMEGTVKLGLPEKYAYLTPSDPIEVEVYEGIYKRCRIQNSNAVDGVDQLECVLDRISTLSSTAVAPTPVEPIPPESNLPTATIFRVMDLPVLVQSHDTLHVYVTAHGGSGYWPGAVIELLVDYEWIEKGQVTYPSTMGTLVEALPYHAPGLDTTNTVLLDLSDDDIGSITQTEFEAGGNACAINGEILNFRDVLVEGDYYRISHIERGGLNTSPVLHAIGDQFVKLVNPTVVPLSSTLVGRTITMRVYTFGTIPSIENEVTFIFEGFSQREWAPLNTTADLNVEGDWELSWEHNERVGAPTDTVVSQHFVEYEIQFGLDPDIHNVTTQNETLTYTEAEQIANFGAPVAAFDYIRINAINEYTGYGDAAFFAGGPPSYDPGLTTFDGSSWYSL